MKPPSVKLDLAYPSASPYVHVNVDYPPAPSAMEGIADVVDSDNVRYAAGAALVFHGYRRTGSIVMALLYGLAGKQIPVIAVPVALAQGFGKKKSCP